jgi:hypothetical protein
MRKRGFVKPIRKNNFTAESAENAEVYILRRTRMAKKVLARGAMTGIAPFLGERSQAAPISANFLTMESLSQAPMWR